MDRLSDFRLGMGVVIKVENDWRNVGLLQIAMHHSSFMHCLIVEKDYLQK